MTVMTTHKKQWSSHNLWTNLTVEHGKKHLIPCRPFSWLFCVSHVLANIYGCLALVGGYWQHHGRRCLNKNNAQESCVWTGLTNDCVEPQLDTVASSSQRQEQDRRMHQQLFPHQASSHQAPIKLSARSKLTIMRRKSAEYQHQRKD